MKNPDLRRLSGQERETILTTNGPSGRATTVRRAVDDPAQYCGAVFNLARGHATSINDLAETLMRLTDTRGEIEYRPARAGDIAHSVADISRLRDRFGWVPQIQLESGLA